MSEDDTTDEGVRCPDCGERKQNIGNHWNLSQSCDYPVITEYQRELAKGLLFAGGGFTNLQEPQRNSALTTTSSSRKLLEWLQDEFGILATSVFQRTDYTPDDSRFADSTVFSWKTRNHPDFAEFIDEWYEDGVKTPPTDIEPSPTMLRVAHAKRGRLTQNGQTIKVNFTVTALAVDAETYASVLSQFEPRIFRSTNSEGGVVETVQLQDSRAFFEYIGFDPVPGAAEQWVAEDAPLSAVTDDWVTCPSCGGTYEKISTHWNATDGGCDYPSITDRQRDLLIGIALCGITPQHGNTTRYRFFRLQSTNRAFLDWLADELGILSTGVTKIEDADAIKTPDSWGDGIESTFDDVYLLSLRPHPEISRIHDRWFTDGTLHPDRVDVTPSPMTLSVIFGHRGSYRAQATGESLPVIRTTQMPFDRETVIQWLDELGLEGRASSANTQSFHVEITNPDAFHEQLEFPVSVKRSE